MILKSLKNEKFAFTHFHIFDDSFRIDDWCDCGENVHPATKEQRDLLFQRMNEAGYEWDAEKKELKKIEKKSAWSEEDEEMLNSIIARLHSHPNVGLEEYSKEYSWLIYTLKSLKPQSRWKPSYWQIEAIKDAVKHYNSLGYNASILKELLNELEKLKG